jgi:tRNA (guanine37-N1)-methyltransferase
MRFDVLTLFPDMFEAVTRYGVIGRAYAAAIWELHCWNPRDFTTRKMGYIDDRPFGGGPGMVMQAAPLSACLQQVDSRVGRRQHRVLLSPTGKPIQQADIRRLARYAGLSLVAGRYEGIDQRFIDRDIDEAFALGDIVVSGGELPAMMLMDAILRWVPGVLQDAQSAQQDSFVDGLLDCPHYTRPESWEDLKVPSILLGGNHEAIGLWRRQQALIATANMRPDLLERARMQGQLSADDERTLAGAYGPLKD